MIVFCTTCKGRAQHIEKTLPRNLADNADYPNCRFVILDYNSADHLLPYLGANHAADVVGGRLAVYGEYSWPGPFRMAHAKNMAHRCGILEGADILVNLDADNFTGPGFASYIAEQFKTFGADSFLWARMIKGEMPRGINGRIVVSKHAFLNLGGYDEKYSTWSPDDKDFNLRLRRVGYIPREIDPRFLDAVVHNDKMRFREYQHISSHPGEESAETMGDSDETVVNFGNFGCGTVIKNSTIRGAAVLVLRERPVKLRPLPTRIFGIGMHKTATTSLHTALMILGLDSAHWENAHWAKAIWEEMSTMGHSRTLERHYAISDLPIPLLYKALDKAYPGSKFILTTRNEQAWLESVKNHWDPDRNKFRLAWSTDPFTHRVHKLLYGQKGFDAGIMLERYRRHNAEVLEYFKDRPRDLLQMDMDNGGSWDLLCSFLDKPIPDVAYPRLYVAPSPPTPEIVILEQMSAKKKKVKRRRRAARFSKPADQAPRLGTTLRVLEVIARGVRMINPWEHGTPKI